VLCAPRAPDGSTVRGCSSAGGSVKARATSALRNARKPIQQIVQFVYLTTRLCSAMNDELERMWKEAFVLYWDTVPATDWRDSEMQPSVCWPPGHGFYPRSAGYDVEAPIAQLHRSGGFVGYLTTTYHQQMLFRNSWTRMYEFMTGTGHAVRTSLWRVACNFTCFVWMWNLGSPTPREECTGRIFESRAAWETFEPKTEENLTWECA
jgi:hypothetical protein